MAIDFQVTPYNQKVTILNDNKYSLIGDPIEGTQPNRPPRLVFEFKGNYPYLTARLNNGQKDREGRPDKVEMALDMVAMQMLISMMEDSIKAREPMCQFLEVRKRGFDPQTKKATDPYVFAIIAVGKDADGCEFIGIQRGKEGGKNYVKMKFNYTAPEFHGLIDSQGQLLSRSKTSSIVARGWVRMLTHMLPLINTHIWDYGKTWEGKQAAKNAENNGNSGNNYNRNNNNGYNNQNNHYNAPAPQPAAQPKNDNFDFDEDITF